MTKQRHSPFKFLSAYTAADKDIFFGRDDEIEALYNMVFKTPLVLVYGMSGTGKTSLIQCGLSTRFEGPDWLPFHIRKGTDINQSIRQALVPALQGKQSNDLTLAIEDLFYNYFRPIYLIFDQFEELFILGEQDEQKKFIQDIQNLQAAKLPCKVLFVMREEYIGQLYEFEKELPGVADFKLRVEPMTNKKVKTVMQQSFEKFNIALADTDNNLYDLMIDNISGGKSGIPLTYLQVYLDMLYVDDYNNTYPNGTNDPLPPLEFTKEKIEKFGKIDDVLERYLKEKVTEIQNKLTEKFPTSHDQTVRTVLDVFVTQDGTKRPIGIQQDQKRYQLDSTISEQLQLLPEVLSFCVDQLEQVRLLRLNEDTIELGHDTLAKLIDQQRTSQQRQLNDIKKRFLGDYKNYQQTQEYLSEKRINVYEEYLPLLMLSESQQQFVTGSRQHNLDLIEAEEARKEKELKLVKDKLTAEEKGRKRQKVFSYWLAGAFSVALCLGFWAWQQKGVAEIARASAFEAQKIAEEAKDNAIAAKNIAEEAKRKAEQERLAKLESKRTNTKERYNNALYQANKFILSLNKEEANSSIESAEILRIEYNDYQTNFEEEQDTISNQKVLSLKARYENLTDQYEKYQDYLKDANRSIRDKKYISAVSFYNKALNTKIEEEGIEAQMIDEIRRGCEYYLEESNKHGGNDTPAGKILAKKYKNDIRDLLKLADRLNLKDTFGIQALAALETKHLR